MSISHYTHLRASPTAGRNILYIPDAELEEKIQFELPMRLH